MSVITATSDGQYIVRPYTAWPLRNTDYRHASNCCALFVKVQQNIVEIFWNYIFLFNQKLAVKTCKLMLYLFHI